MLGSIAHSKVFRAFFITLWSISLAVAFLLTLQVMGIITQFNQRLPVAVQAAQPSGHGPYSYGVPMEMEQFSQTETFQSPAILLEDGQRLGPGNAQHADIGLKGNGRFSFWKGGLIFSSSDNSDPRTNGRQYVLILPPPLTLNKWVWISYLLAIIITLVFVRQYRLDLRAKMHRLASTMEFYRKNIPQKLLWGILLSVVAILAVGSRDVFPVFLAKINARTGVYSRVIDLYGYPIQTEQANPPFFAFDISVLGLVSLADKPGGPPHSPVILLENGIPLTPHTPLNDIRTAKPGLFVHLRYQPSDFNDAYLNPLNRQDVILFTPRSGDPKENVYTLIVPATKADAYALGIPDNYSRILWVLVIIVSVIAGWLIQRSIGDLSPLWYQIPLALALCVAYFLMTTVGIMKTQPCTPAGAYSVWNVFCVAPDSASYYQGYAPGSTRGPGYPLFIRLVAGDWNDLRHLVNIKPLSINASIDDDTQPLMKVSRVQVFMLLTAGVILCFTMMRMLRTSLAPVFFLFFYDFHLFIFYELNSILTESLTQVWLLLMVACFLAFLLRGKMWLLPAAALLVGFSYVTRQASVYLAIMLGAMILWAIVKDWRKYWKASALSLLLLAFLAATPNLYALLITGRSGQESLTYQYRAVFALRLAEEDDVQYMPDAESRQWLAAALKRRDVKDKENDIMCAYEAYCMWVYRIQSPYEVAIVKAEEVHEPSFYIQVSDSILRRHWLDYLKLGLDGWATAMVSPQIDRLQLFEGYFGIPPVNSWYIYLAAFILIGIIRGKAGYASAVLILSHWAHVLISCLFSAPLPRMVWASDGLVFIAFFIVALETARKGYPPLKAFVTKALPKE